MFCFLLACLRLNSSWLSDELSNNIMIVCTSNCYVCIKNKVFACSNSGLSHTNDYVCVTKFRFCIKIAAINFKNDQFLDDQFLEGVVHIVCSFLVPKQSRFRVIGSKQNHYFDVLGQPIKMLICAWPQKTNILIFQASNQNLDLLVPQNQNIGVGGPTK